MVIVRLVKKAKRGDKQAFIKLFEQYEQDIYRLAFVYLNHQQDALDVVQDTAYRSYKSIASLREPRYFKTWLLRIAIRSSIDLLHKRRRTVPLLDNYPQTAVAADGEEDIPLSISLQALIDTLDEEEKTVIMTRFYQDLTIKQISEMLELPLGTVKSILYRALKKLRLLAKEEDVYEQ